MKDKYFICTNYNCTATKEIQTSRSKIKCERCGKAMKEGSIIKGDKNIKENEILKNTKYLYVVSA